MPAGTPPAATLRRLRPSLLLGALTTIGGFGGFVGTGFPGVREMGIFAVCGVAAALAATLFAVPVFLPTGAPPPRVPAATAAALGGWLMSRVGFESYGPLIVAMAAISALLIWRGPAIPAGR